ncbi:NAD(P)/FAD-dependent oxidoreductase [Pseudotabrizicola sp. L79]|uniref:NAD(P)/FAD-dependent oxidoreductase n=1 Tax=Pseudotabrizicola sp. L79 TaxID=3118402 RepID=UPI002F93B56E
MKASYDVVIVGGAVIGSAVAYFLMSNPDFTGSVLVVERDPSFAQSSTALSAASIRTQFSNPINVKISQFGLEVIRDFGTLMQVDGQPKPDLNFHEAGYLFLANTPSQVQILRENHAVQRACGADVVLWDRDELAHAFPHLRVDDVLLASYGQSNEGWFNNTGLMNGFRAKARSLGAEVVTDEVVAIDRHGGRVTGITLKSGAKVQAGTVVNASGPRAAQTARMAGLDVPVEPRKRTLFVLDCATSPEGTARVAGGRLPLMVDTTGLFIRPEGRFFLTGCPPVEDPGVDWDDFNPRHEEFEDIIWPALAERSAAFEAVKVVNMWAGHYDFNTLDHNLIVGRHPEVTNFIFANGFSGHGLQQGPAAGRAVAELIIYGVYRSLDMSQVGYERIIEGRPFLEKAVI